MQDVIRQASYRMTGTAESSQPTSKLSLHHRWFIVLLALAGLLSIIPPAAKVRAQ